MIKKPIVITVSGPSTSGKTTFASLFIPLGYKEIVSTTTRPIRTGEIDGVNYHFVDNNAFENMIKNEDLIEHIQVGKYYYGVSKNAINDVIENGHPAVLVVEPNGANEVAKFCNEKSITLHKVFINNPLEILIKRLEDRKSKDLNAIESVYKERLWNIEVFEPAAWTEKAYNGEHHYDQIFDTFNPENQFYTLNSVLSEVDNKINNSNLKKKIIN